MTHTPQTLWRCEQCGKWSHAKRRPLRHKVWHQHDAAERWRGWFVYCGPFRRWDAWPTPEVGHVEYVALGEPVSPIEVEVAKDYESLGTF
jgi:hypothetical protein